MTAFASYMRGEEPVKLLKCIIQPDRLDRVKDALAEISVQGMTVSEVRGFGRFQEEPVSRSAREKTAFATRLQIEVIVPDDRARSAMDAMIDAVRTGNTGDGKLFIMNVDQAVRIRTGESDDEAL